MSTPPVRELTRSVSTASPNGPMPPTVCAVTKMPTSTSSAQATRRSKRSAAQARNRTGAKVSVELAPGTKVSTLAAESSTICASSSSLPPVQWFSVTTASGKSSSTAATCAANEVASDTPSGSRVTSREAVDPAEHEHAAADHGRAEQPDEVLLVDQPRPGPAGVGDQQRRDDQRDRLDHAVRDREPHAPVGDEVTGRGREDQQRAQEQPPAHRGEREQDQTQPGRRPERRDCPAVGREVHRDGTGGDRPLRAGRMRRPAEGSIGVGGHPISLGHLTCPALDFDTSRGNPGASRSGGPALGWRHVGLRAHRAVLRGRRIRTRPTGVHRVRRRGPLGGPPARTADAAPDAPAAGPGAGGRGAARGHPRPAGPRSLGPPVGPARLLHDGLRRAGRGAARPPRGHRGDHRRYVARRERRAGGRRPRA